MEWKIIQGYPKDIQMKLNQWKHNYHIHIHGYDVSSADDGSTWVCLLLTREKK